MTTTLRKASPFRLASLSLTAALLIALFVALACGSSEPSEQASGDATPEPTATAEATGTPTPEPTATPEADTENLSPEVNAILALHTAEQSREEGAAGSSESGPPSLEKVSLYISTKRNFNQPLQTFLTDNGATVIRWEENASGTHYHSGIRAEVPVSLIPALSRQPGFSYAITEYTRYEKLEGQLSNLVMLYETGAITAEEGARRSFARRGDSGELVALEVYIESCENIPAIARFREKVLGNLPWWYDPNDDCYGSYVASVAREPYVEISVPFSSLVKLSQELGVRRIELLPIQPSGENLDAPQLGVTPLVSSGSVGQQAGGTAVGVHGADRWYDATSPLTGSGVKIGIIDSGFTGFSGLTAGVDIPLLAKVKTYCWDQNGILSTTKINACEYATSYGTVVSEAAYDIAPGAERH